MIKIGTKDNNGNPLVGLGIEEVDFEKLKNGQSWSFEINGQVVHVCFIGSVDELKKKLETQGLKPREKNQTDQQPR